MDQCRSLHRKVDPLRLEHRLLRVCKTRRKEKGQGGEEDRRRLQRTRTYVFEPLPEPSEYDDRVGERREDEEGSDESLENLAGTKEEEVSARTEKVE